MLSATTGCEELTARRKIQKGDKLYQDGRFSKAVVLYEEALKAAPDLEIGHHNAGLAYLMLFVPGDTKELNVALAERATEHLQIYLEGNPDDSRIRELMTTAWIDSDQFDRALIYWEELLTKEPNNSDVLVTLAGINSKAGRYDKAIEWHLKRVEIEPEAQGKAQAYIAIGDMQRARLTNGEVVDLERLALADIGLAALQKAEGLDPSGPLIQSLLGSVYQLRALAHGSSWARQIDTASQRYHQLRWMELTKKAKAKAKEEAAAATPDPPPNSSPNKAEAEK